MIGVNVRDFERQRLFSFLVSNCILLLMDGWLLFSADSDISSKIFLTDLLKLFESETFGDTENDFN